MAIDVLTGLPDNESGQQQSPQQSAQGQNPQTAQPQGPQAQQSAPQAGGSSGLQLTDDHKTRLTGIINQMEANHESPDDIQKLVTGYAQKYGTRAQQTPQASPGMWDYAKSLFGGDRKSTRLNSSH